MSLDPEALTLGPGDVALAAGSIALPQERRRAPGSLDRLLGGRWALPVLDFLALAGALACAVLWLGPDAGHWAHVTVFPLFGIVALAVRGAYAPRLRLALLDFFGHAAGSASVAAMCTLAFGLLVSSGDPGSPLLFRAWLIGLVLLSANRVLYTLEQHRLRASGVAARRTLIVGAGEVGARIGRRLAESPAYGLRPVGYVDADPPSADAVGGRPAPVLGSLEDLPALIQRLEVEHVILAFSGASDRTLLPVVRTCSAMGVAVSLVPRLFDSINNRVAYEPVGGLPIVTLRSTNPSGLTFAVKHAIDRVVAGVLVLALAPLFAAIALAVRLSSPGAVLFRQRRVGRDDQEFDMLKFRSMRGEPASEFKLRAGSAPGGVEGIDRRTTIGRWLRRTSLDELPQLINVLRGEMSLVGPRPERPEFVRAFALDLARYTERHRVRAGITGLSQVRGLRGQSSIADRVELDNYYIEHWSLGLDLKILLMTVLAVFRPAQ